MAINWRPNTRVLILLVASVGLLAAGFWLRAVFNPVLVALLGAYILNPAVEYYEQRGLSRRLAVTALFAAALFGIAGVSTLLTVQVARSLPEFRITLIGEPFILPGEDSEGLPVLKLPNGRSFLDLDGNGHYSDGFVERTTARLEPMLKNLPEESVVKLKEALQRSAGRIGDGVIEGVSAIRRGASSLFDLFSYLMLVPFYGFFFLLNFSTMRETVRRYLPARTRDEIVGLVAEIDASVAAFFRGRLLIAIGKGLVTALGLWLLSVPFAVPLGLGAGLLSFIPALGPLVGFAAAALLGLGPAESVGAFLLWLFAVFAVAEFLEALAMPVVLGKEVGLHPVSLVLALLVFGNLFGFFGVLLSVPIASICKILGARYLMPTLQELAAGEPGSEPGSAAEEQRGNQKVDVEAQGIVEGRDKGAGGERRVDVNLVKEQRNDGPDDAGIDHPREHPEADDKAKAGIEASRASPATQEPVEDGRADEGEAPADAAED